MAAFMGMRGNGDWADNQVPESWREAILYQYPNGTAPLTAMMSMFKSESVDSYAHNWWTKTLPTQEITGTAGAFLYIDVGLGTPYVYATHQATHGIAGATLYAKTTAALVNEFRIGHTVVLKDDDRYTVDLVAKVTAVNSNGDSSYIALQLKEADDNDSDSSTYNLATVNTMIIQGNVNPEGGPMPRAVAYDPVQYTNYTQIWRTPLELTGTAIATKLRTGDAFKEAQRECLELHSIEMEMSTIFGIRDGSSTGANGKPERMAGGLLWFIKTFATLNHNDYRLNSDYSTLDWLDGGEDWFDEYLALLFRYLSGGEAFFIVGDGAMLGLNKLAKTHGNIQLTSGPSKTYGIELVTWQTNFGRVHLKTHPLFSHRDSTRYSMLGMHPKNMRFRPLRTRDTQYQKDQQAKGIDGLVEGYLTEGTFEFFHPLQFLFLDGVGRDNPGV